MYRIVRFYQDAHPHRRIIERGLTLEQAQEHCSNPETSSSTCTSAVGRRRTKRLGPWFDGYRTSGRDNVTQHTPGPWRHEYVNGAHRVFWGKKLSERIATEVWACGNGGAEEEAANAQLIAASPNLLVELKDLVNYCEAEGLPDAALDGPRGAIAKAKGETQ